MLANVNGQIRSCITAGPIPNHTNIFVATTRIDIDTRSPGMWIQPKYNRSVATVFNFYVTSGNSCVASSAQTRADFITS